MAGKKYLVQTRRRTGSWAHRSSHGSQREETIAEMFSTGEE